MTTAFSLRSMLLAALGFPFIVFHENVLLVMILRVLSRALDFFLPNAQSSPTRLVWGCSPVSVLLFPSSVRCCWKSSHDGTLALHCCFAPSLCRRGPTRAGSLSSSLDFLCVFCVLPLVLLIGMPMAAIVAFLAMAVSVIAAFLRKRGVCEK